MPLKILCLIHAAGDDDVIGYVEHCEGMRNAQGSSRTMCGIYVVGTECAHEGLPGWHPAAARGRVKLVVKPNIKWMGEIRTADSMYPTSVAHNIHPAFLNPARIFRSQCCRRPLSASRTPTHKRGRHINHFLITCAMSPTEKTTAVVAL